MSRYKTGLEELDEVNMLMKYLYMSDEHYVMFENTIGIQFKLTMTDDFELKREMINGAIPGTIFPCTDFSCNVLMAVIDQLKKQPAAELPGSFQNRWEELRTITAGNLALNAGF